MHGPLSHIERPELVDRRDLSLLVDRRKERGEKEGGERKERKERERERDSIIICAAASKPAPHAAETQGRRTVICIITSFSLLHVPTCTIELLYSAKCNQQRRQRQRHRQQHQQRHRTSLTSKQPWTNSRQKRSSIIEMPFPSLYASPSSSPSSSSSSPST